MGEQPYESLLASLADAVALAGKLQRELASAQERIGELEASKSAPINDDIQLLVARARKWADNWSSSQQMADAEIIRSLCDALEVSKPAEGTWQPIETAPNDLIPVLMYFASNDTFGVAYAKVRDYHGLMPTHWMPLPAPPATEPAAAGKGWGQASKPAAGTWQWALEQMKAGKRTKRIAWPHGYWIFFRFDGLLIDQQGRCASLRRFDFELADWQLAPIEPAAGKREENLDQQD